MEPITFEDYGLSKELGKALEGLGFTSPTKVQQEVIPVALGGKDLVVQSKTGSGKTAAFAIPICEKVDWEDNKPQALVLTPTRELAMQVAEDFFHIGRFKRMKVVALYGKASFMHQQKQIKQKTHVVVGTPGRVIDHLEKGTWSTENIRYLVIDEADEMLRMGFVEQIRTILSFLPKERVTMLFSATMPKDIQALCEDVLSSPVHIEIESPLRTTEQVEEIGHFVKEEEKTAALYRVLRVENPESCMIFCNTKVQVDKVYDDIRALDVPCMKLHGGMEQRDRQQVMEDFRRGYSRYLVATDVAARGIDIDHITHVVNYDLPEDKENYVHRIGRTGRAGRTGKSISFITPRDSIFLKAIESYRGNVIPKGTLPEEAEAQKHQEAFDKKSRIRLEVKEKESATDIMKLHINAGKKTKMRPVDVVGTLCNLQGMTADDIGIINVLDVSTFVEILGGKGESVLKQLQHIPIKGRLRKVTKADR
ncbi:MAG: DEAD/DEAH box helicase [Cellulosilyticaceae bacterium]